MSGLSKGLLVSLLLHGLVFAVVYALPFEREVRREIVPADFTLIESVDLRASAEDTRIASMRGSTLSQRKSLEKSARTPSAHGGVSATQERLLTEMGENPPDTRTQIPVAQGEPPSSQEGAPVGGSPGTDIAWSESSSGPGRPMLTSLGSGEGAARGGGSGDDGSYLSALRRIRDEVMRNVTYPERARRMGWEGRVIISFMLHEDGTVHDARILQSSGVTALDEATKEALKKSVIHPQTIKIAKRVHVVLPIEYRLR